MEILRDIGNVLSAPRRALWTGLGLPDNGEDLVDKMGLEKGSLLSRGLGVGAEIAGDPMTYLLGGLGATIYGARGMLEGGEAAGAAGEGIDALNSARRAAQEGLVERAGQGADTVAEQQARFEGMRGSVDPDSMANVDYKNYKGATPEATDALEKAGLGTGDGGQGATIYGARKPVGLDVKAIGAGGGKSALRGRGLALGDEALPTMTPYERYLMMREGQAARSAGVDVASIHNTADPLADVAMRRSAEINGARPMPTLADQMQANFMPRAHIDAARAMGLGDLPIDKGFERAQSMLAQALEARQIAQAGQLATRDYAMIGAAGGAAGGAGGTLAKSLTG
jgi:hypothetical protein